MQDIKGNELPKCGTRHVVPGLNVVAMVAPQGGHGLLIGATTETQNQKLIKPRP